MTRHTSRRPKVNLELFLKSMEHYVQMIHNVQLRKGLLQKKAPPTTSKGTPRGFIRGDAPPLIGMTTPTTPAKPTSTSFNTISTVPPSTSSTTYSITTPRSIHHLNQNQKDQLQSKLVQKHFLGLVAAPVPKGPPEGLILPTEWLQHH